jgi:hypothetical protein
MPRLKDQLTAAGDSLQAAGFAVVRLLTPRGMKYDAAKEFYEPYNCIKVRNAEMRNDIEELIEWALEHNLELYILVNNKAEGCAPMTIQEMDERFQENMRKAEG